MTKYFIFLLPLILTFSSCHRQAAKSKRAAEKDSLAAVVTKKDSVVVKKTTPKDSAVKIAEDLKVDVQSVDFKYLTAKSKISFKSKTQNFDNANLNLRMRKDSAIWFSVVYGIEVARGIITKDSVKIMDRVHTEYYTYDFDSLSRAFNFKLSYSLLQSILVGNMPIPKKPNQKFKKEKDYFLLKQEEGKVQVDNYIGEQNRRLKKMLVTDQPTKNTLTLDYEDFTALNNYLFPFSSLVQLNYQSKEDNKQYQTVFSLKHQKIEILETPISFPFVVPAKYKKK